MEVSKPFFYGVLALSLGSAALGAVAAFGRRDVTASVAPGSCTCDDTALRRELAELRRALDARAPDASVKRLAERVAALEAGNGGSAKPADGTPAASPSPSATAAPKLTFEVPNEGLAIRQEPGGAIAVTNSDPALTGQHLKVTARAEDGSTQELSIIVPAPGR